LQTDKELEDELYHKLKAVGINVDQIKGLELSLSQLEDFHRRIMNLIKNRTGWFDEIN